MDLTTSRRFVLPMNASFASKSVLHSKVIIMRGKSFFLFVSEGNVRIRAHSSHSFRTLIDVMAVVNARARTTGVQCACLDF